MFTNIGPDQARQLIERGDVEVVDVREPNEWASGHLPGARLVTLEQIRKGGRATLPQDSVLFVCAAGVRSETAARFAASLGLTKVYSLRGGTRSWVKAGLPLVQALSEAV